MTPDERYEQLMGWPLEELVELVLGLESVQLCADCKPAVCAAVLEHQPGCGCWDDLCVE